MGRGWAFARVQAGRVSRACCWALGHKHGWSLFLTIGVPPTYKALTSACKGRVGSHQESHSPLRARLSPTRTPEQGDLRSLGDRAEQWVERPSLQRHRGFLWFH